jgi:hypothetical protein
MWNHFAQSKNQTQTQTLLYEWWQVDYTLHLAWVLVVEWSSTEGYPLMEGLS